MSDKPPSTLAVAHNHSHRPGGCVATIFFHLLDWNKRFAKRRNKLFSRKLLPPARTKPSKRFGGDEKMPRTALHLMPDHTTHQHFRNANKSDNPGSVGLDHINEMRSPSLVARLMGLDSMPAVFPDKPNKPSRATSVLDMRDKTQCPRYNVEEGLILEREFGQIEPRPQKIQRTGSVQRRGAVTRLGADSFQLKAVLSRPRMHHHRPKLPYAAKSPRLSTSRSASRTSRLIDAATRILEPGLQATNKARSSLTYSTSLRYSSEDKIMSQGMATERSLRASDEMSRNQPSTGQASCKNCGTLIKAAVSSPLDEQGSSGYSSIDSCAVDAPSQMHDDTFPSHFPRTSFNLFGDAMLQRTQSRHVSFTDLNESRKQCRMGLDVYGGPACQDGQAVWENVLQNNEHLICASKPRPQTQTETPADAETLPLKSKFIKNENKRSSSASAVNAVSHQVKDFVALNRNLSRYTRPRVTSKIEGSHFPSQKTSCDGIDGSVRERGNASLYRQIQNRHFFSSSHGIDTELRNDVVIAKEMLTAEPMNQAVTESRSVEQRNASRCKVVSDGAVNLSFNSTSDKRGRSCVGRNGKRKDHNGGSGRVTALQIKINSDEAKSLQNKVPRKEDGLAVLKELKFTELTSQEEDVLTAKQAEPKRSTAMILDELISALTAEHGTCQDSRFNNSDAASQTEEDALVSWAKKFDHQSPGSVLEASFSNDSCVSSSLDDNSGNCRYIHPVEGIGVAECDEDILDSAASFKEGITSGEMVTHLMDQISHRLSNIDEHDLQLSGERLLHVKEVMRKIEVLFGKPAEGGSWDGILLLPFVKEEVETLAEAMQLDISSFLGIAQTDQQLRRFLFDCAIECIESKYGRWHSVGYQAWRRLASSIKCMSFVQEVGRAVRKWSNFAGMVCDEIIEWEMSDLVGKWREFESEVFEAGREIDGEILGGLVEEVVVELWEDLVCY